MSQVIYEKLKSIARKRDVIYYSDLGNMGDPAVYSEIVRILDEINRSEFNEGNPMLSAVVISKDRQLPGKGFFDLARKLEKYRGYKDSLFWAYELIEVHNFWQSH